MATPHRGLTARGFDGATGAQERLVRARDHMRLEHLETHNIAGCGTYATCATDALYGLISWRAIASHRAHPRPVSPVAL